MTLVPTDDRVLIRPVPKPETTESGLHLVEHWKPDVVGHVVTLGPQCRWLVRPGDLVLFSWQEGQELTFEGERYIMMRESEILARIEE